MDHIKHSNRLNITTNGRSPGGVLKRPTNTVARVRISLALLVTGILLGLANPRVTANDTEPPLLVGYERFHRAESAPSAEAGAYLFGELQCGACHQSTAGPNAGKSAPRLTGVGGRVQADFIREFLRDPHAVKPGTTMPDMSSRLPADSKDEAIDAMAQFLGSLGSLAQSAPSSSDVAMGEELFHTVGCIACHQTQRENQTPARHAVPLPKLELKYSLPSLASFLKDPLEIRPSARMPHLNLNENEARQIASYLLREIDVPPNMTVRYYEGNWDNLPDFSTLTLKSEFAATSFNVSSLPRANEFGLIFTGYLNVTQAGEFEVRIGSDDGSRILIDGEEITRVDGVHPFQSKTATVRLSEGIRRIDVEYFEKGGEELLRVEMGGPSFSMQPLSGLLRATRQAAEQPEEQAEFDSAAIASGAAHFVSSGCANCHELDTNGQDLPEGLSAGLLTSTAEFVAVEELDVTGGALAEGGDNSCPDYALDAHQRTSLRLYVDSLMEGQASRNDPVDAGLAAEQSIHETMLTFNCYACHERGDLGGVPTDRNEWFAGDEPEMGDEGRLPPPLTGVGAKLNPDWLTYLLNEGAKDRPYMKTRMPRFGNENVGQLVSAFQQADPLERVPDFTIDETDRRVKVSGRFFAGRRAFNCIQCHTFGNQRSTGVQAISLTTMTQRLNKDWFQLYMLDPNKYRPGTRMPASWPRGKVFYPDILGGDMHAQVHSMWAYLADGTNASAPEGLGTLGILLEPDEEPIIYRNFIQGSGARAIGVGYPERVNLAFDAEHQRLALIWQGSFIDASRHWTGRGQGFQGPAGENILSFPDAPLLAELSMAEDAWPDPVEVREQWRFRGYRFDQERRPAFRYQFGDVTVNDQFTPTTDGDYPSLIRTIELTGESDRELWLLVARGNEVEQVGGNRVSVNDWQIEFPAETAFLIVPTDRGREIRVPVQTDDESAFRIEWKYLW